MKIHPFYRAPKIRYRKPENPDMQDNLERLKRWPGLKNQWIGKTVYILSDGWYWRPDSCGYTSDGLEAGKYDFEDAWKCTSHCGPEKRIVYKVV